MHTILAKAMQFCLSFTKTLAPLSSGNLLQVPQHKMTDEIVENLETSDDNASLEDSSDILVVQY